LKHTLLEVIIEVEGRDRLKQCALNFDNCHASNPCPIHHLIISEKEAFWKAFKGIKLSDL